MASPPSAARGALIVRERGRPAVGGQVRGAATVATDVELMHRSMGFAALGLVTLVPLLGLHGRGEPAGSEDVAYPGFGGWIVDAMGISGRSAASAQDLFTATAPGA
ncbi:hypothetical protein ACU686_10775 [Yinghuangia aomiensis]